MITPLYAQLTPLRIPNDRVLSDANAISYISAVQTADGQELENNVKFAFEDFIVGCKNDGIWTSIKASCILAGARTLSGALVQLVGAAPTNNNFVSGDYDRKTGLKGNFATKWLDSNRNNNADPQNSKHLAAWIQNNPTTSANAYGIIGCSSTTGTSQITHNSIGKIARLNAQTSTPSSTANTSTGFIGASRDNSASFQFRFGGTNITYTSTSQVPLNRNISVFALKTITFSVPTDARIPFYSIGESLDLAKLDTRVSTLMTDLSAAIP